MVPKSQDAHRSVPPIDKGLVRRLIATQFPEWAHLPVAPGEPGGWDNRTFRLGAHMSVRLPSAAAYAVQVDKEHQWLPRLAPLLTLSIPQPLARGAPGEGYPWPWSVYAWIDGEPASTATITDLVRFAKSLACFLRAIQNIDPSGGPPAGAHNFHRGGELAIYDGETRAAISALAGRIDAAGAMDLWMAALAAPRHSGPVWIHGDIAPGNLLVQEGRLQAVIDFGGTAIGDPACDLVIAWILFAGESREAFRAALHLDEATWARARGWALWKALITAAGHDSYQREAARSWQVIEDVLEDHRVRRLRDQA